MRMPNIFIRFLIPILLSLCIGNLDATPSPIQSSYSKLKQFNDYFYKFSEKIVQGQKLSQDELNQAIEQAQLRRNEIVKVIQTDPNFIQQIVLPKEIRNKLPKNLKPYLEEEVKNIEGVFSIREALYRTEQKKMSSILQYTLTDADNNISSIYFMGQPNKDWVTGDKVRLKNAYKIPLNSASPNLTANLYIVSTSQLVILKKKSHAIPKSFGPQKTVVFMVNFLSNPQQPWTLNQARQVIINDLSNMYNEFSYGQTSMTGIVVGWYTLNVNTNADCTSILNAIPPLAAAAARNAGVDLSPYKHRVYVSPAIANCGMQGGVSTVLWDEYSNTWMFGELDDSLAGHEIGHALGLYHSHSLHCPGTVNTGNCTQEEYGDYADVMGAEGVSHFNAFQKDRLGWLNYGSSPPIRTVNTSGTYNIDAYETNNRNLKALKILKRNLSDGSHDYYYVEFRQGIGFDSALGSCRNCDYTRGVIVHQANDRDPNTSNLLDMSPSDNNLRYAALLPGRSFRDGSTPNGGVIITANSISSSGASVRVTFGSSTPTPPPPDNLTYSYNVRLGYPFNPVTINGNINCPNINGVPVCLISNQPVGGRLSITGGNNHVCTFIVQSNGGLNSTSPSVNCFVTVQAATSTQAGSISLPSGF